MENEKWDLYAGEYHDNIISPFQDNVQNPLKTEIEIKDTKELTVADIGCGIGDLVPFLSEQFRHVYAIDFSQKMLEKTQERHAALTNVTFRQADMRELTSLGVTFDVAVAVNSVLLPNPLDVQRSFEQIHASINPGGLFLGIFPAMESVLYNASLVYDRELKKWGDEEKAMKETRRIVEGKKFNFITATFEDKKDEKQKFYYEFELRNRLSQAGFKNIEFKKVLYPWGKESGGYEDFFGMPEMWDWYVTARK